MSDPNGSERRPAALQELVRTRVMAIVRTRHTAVIPDLVRTLVEGGLTMVEIALASPDTLDGVRATRRLGITELILGVGTVLTAEEGRSALQAGASFLVSPAVIPEVITDATSRGIAIFPGAYTPTEILSAANAGAVAVKVFPASVGGPQYIAALEGPFPDIPLLPTGGVQLSDVRAYLEAGATAVAIGSPLVQDADITGDTAALRSRARKVAELAST